MHNEPFKPKKPYKLRPEEIRPLATGRGGCLATDQITIEGRPVGYMYREAPDSDMPDSGWRFFSGLESDEYVNDPSNIAIYDVNTIANYDPAIIPLLDSPSGTAYVRLAGTDEFVSEAFSPPED